MGLWIILLAGSMGVEIPYEVVSSSGTVTTGTHVIQEVGISMLMVGMIIVCLIMMIGMFADFKRARRFKM